MHLLVGAVFVIGPAFVAVARNEGMAAVASLTGFAAFLTLVAGYPAVRLIEPKPPRA